MWGQRVKEVSMAEAKNINLIQINLIYVEAKGVQQILNRFLMKESRLSAKWASGLWEND